MPQTTTHSTRSEFERNVFVNCPLDELYRPLFRTLIFGILDCGFIARCALELEDSSEPRSVKIIRLIHESRFGIHDLSRIELNEIGFPRFNMPYELGLFVGMKHSGIKKQSQKRALILDCEPYRYQAFLSDVAGQDIRSHGNDPARYLAELRHWLQNQEQQRNLPGVDSLHNRYEQFRRESPELLAVMKKTDADLDNYRDLHNFVTTWITEHPFS